MSVLRLQALKLTPAEAAAIAACFKSKNFSGFQASGVVVETEKYQFLREEDGKLVLAKKKGSGGLTLQASKTGSFALRSLTVQLLNGLVVLLASMTGLPNA